MPVHELVPEYVPAMEDAEAWASPATSVLHESYGLSKPPAGMSIVKWSAVPDTVPETEPRPALLVAVSLIVSVPEQDEPV